ncbi:MAG: AAA family ATPase [bacterium]|nr:AAA family ATPase [bacterium]
MDSAAAQSQTADISPAQVEQLCADFRRDYDAIAAEVGRVIVGQRDVVQEVLVTLLADGHALLEGVPGLAKTLLIRTLSDALHVEFSRIQFTPDLMPSDITGTNIIEEDDHGRKSYKFIAGPVFASIILADEINRATPKTQSAMLEAMQERSVTIYGERRALPEPFIVLATQNPLEQEGTYPLPEAQLDRFMLKILLGFPHEDELMEIMERTTTATIVKANRVLTGSRLLEMKQLVRRVAAAPHVARYAVRLCTASHPDNVRAPESVKRYVRYGASPRGVQALILGGKVLALLDGRFNLAFDDIRALAPAALRHRVILNFEAEAEGRSADSIIKDIIAAIPASAD